MTTTTDRAQAAAAAHTLAYAAQRQAIAQRNPVLAAFWAGTCDACLAELEECAAALRAEADADPEADGCNCASCLAELDPPPAADLIQRGNADLPPLSGHASLR